jgi:hypothetical protein
VAHRGSGTKAGVPTMHRLVAAHKALACWGLGVRRRGFVFGRR